MLRKKVNLRPEVYQALLDESRLRQQDPEAVLEDMIMTSISPKTEEVLEKLKRNMEMKPALEENPEAIEAIKDLWLDYPRLSTFNIAEKIGCTIQSAKLSSSCSEKESLNRGVTFLQYRKRRDESLQLQIYKAL
jgi:antitoxin component HigA of HigAB toxin-antitoxin module